MPIFSFALAGDLPPGSGTTVTLPDVAAARVAALRFATQSLAELPTTAGAALDWHLDVRDDDGLIQFSIYISVVSAPVAMNA